MTDDNEPQPDEDLIVPNDDAPIDDEAEPLDAGHPDADPAEDEGL